MAETPNSLGDCVVCPIATAQTLGELAGQYVAPQDWLFAKPEERDVTGFFSADAVRTAVTFYQVSGNPDSGRYGAPQDVAKLTSTDLWLAQRSALTGDHVRPTDVAAMQAAAKRRAVAREAFAALPIAARQARARRAAPFLLDVAASLQDFEPEVREQDFLGELFAAIKSGNHGGDIIDQARGIVGAARSLRTLHGLDQGMFLVARTALKECDGPWMLFTPPHGLFRRKSGYTTVCPNGPRNRQYYEASSADKIARSNGNA